MKITVIGAGYVGLVSAACFAEGGNNVVCVDKDNGKVGDLNKAVISIYEPGLSDIVKRNIEAGRLRFTTNLRKAIDTSLFIFIAVGTPSADDGSADISQVLHLAGQIASLMVDYRIIVTKSTVPVGTCRKICEIIKRKTDIAFDYVSNPEFLKEGSAVEDFLKPDRVIVGVKKPFLKNLLKELYAPFMRKNSRIVFMDPASAEMSKYAANAMLATRISFMNEISVLCEKFGADIEMVRRGLGSDRRIGPACLFAGLGYGGSCFPKDVRALIHMGEANDAEMTIAKAVQQVNYNQQHRFAEMVLEYFRVHRNNSTIAVWGLSFKAKTDDIRESPAIGCVKKLIAAGLTIKAYDPQASSAARKLFDKKIEIVKNSYDALENADALVIFTDWQEFRTPDFDVIADRLKDPVIFDGRNLYDPECPRSHHIKYFSIGRPAVLF